MKLSEKYPPRSSVRFRLQNANPSSKGPPRIPSSGSAFFARNRFGIPTGIFFRQLRNYSRARAALPAPFACANGTEHGLALGKGFAVSPPLFCPYRGVGPSSLGLGPPLAFASGRHCSHLGAFARRLLAATFLSQNFHSTRVSRLSSLPAETERVTVWIANGIIP